MRRFLPHGLRILDILHSLLICFPFYIHRFNHISQEKLNQAIILEVCALRIGSTAPNKRIVKLDQHFLRDIFDLLGVLELHCKFHVAFDEVLEVFLACFRQFFFVLPFHLEVFFFVNFLSIYDWWFVARSDEGGLYNFFYFSEVKVFDKLSVIHLVISTITYPLRFLLIVHDLLVFLFLHFHLKLVIAVPRSYMSLTPYLNITQLLVKFCLRFFHHQIPYQPINLRIRYFLPADLLQLIL